MDAEYEVEIDFDEYTDEELLYITFTFEVFKQQILRKLDNDKEMALLQFTNWILDLLREEAKARQYQSGGVPIC